MLQQIVWICWLTSNLCKDSCIVVDGVKKSYNWIWEWEELEEWRTWTSSDGKMGKNHNEYRAWGDGRIWLSIGSSDLEMMVLDIKIFIFERL